MTKGLRVLVFLLFAVALALPIWTSRTVEGQAATEAPTGFDTLTNGMSPKPCMMEIEQRSRNEMG